MILKYLPLFSLLFVKSAIAQTAPPANTVAIKQALNKMQVLGSVLYIAAHPDDENTNLLAYLAQEKHYRTGYLSLTRGDGGQNLIGNEQSELLGLIRTQELLAARRVDGAEQFFTRANDFGFSKNPEETLKIWDREKILGDVVWVIRKFRPDIMITRFPTTGEGGHGHHTSSAILAQEAFAAAADPKRFPEQLKYVQPWQAKRLLWNTFNFGGTNLTAPDQFKIDVGVYNPLLGKNIGEIAAESRSNHRSQGFGTARQRGQYFEYFKTILGDAPKTDLMDGVDVTWNRVKGSEGISAAIADIKKNFDDEHPERSVKNELKLLGMIQKLSKAYWRDEKDGELKDLIVACSGLWFEAYSFAPTYALGDTIRVKAQMIGRHPLVVSSNINAGGYATMSTISTHGFLLESNQMENRSSSRGTTPYAKNLSQPYWLAAPHGIGMYTLPNDTLVGNPENPDAPKVIFTLGFGMDTGLFKIKVDRKLVYKFTDPAKGEIYQPVEITPPITANIAGKNYIYTLQMNKPQTVQVNLKAFVDGNGSVSLKPVQGWKISPAKIDFTGKKKGDEWVAEFQVSPLDGRPKNDVVTAVAEINGQTSSLGFMRIKYDHIPNITLFPPAEAKLVNIDLLVKGKKIGYINGAGDQVADALKQVGFDVVMLTEDEVLHGNLSSYDAIVAGVRAYNVNPRMVVMQPKLLEYVNAGGTYLVQYNTYNNLVTNQIGPYPFKVVNQRVTDESAPVNYVLPNSPLLNYPNKITQDDMKDWVQERGLYFAASIDPKYQTPFEMNDPGEKANNGSLIYTDYGKGRFVYTSLDFFRELPAGVPGAYRLFINLLARPK
ncbi:PIG-L family deacetylase [Mucilaginibacter myungsuensis]|uniref:PIG-L family deacetylase n=1 Tax=Mucilaginibacter myungsuensis TaxID=649104 RepID=A0A929L0Z6_9SPHI|nr:PIG-L family deacetylase [Mucilaginibacter myungsuensis]MBE9661276.1 PIG-L family deacetylase [Mucilaginibacter myungsuensis]MDN3597419.1 PIG-L family deacetylase [Mucilaginibacter myungsuensis]